MLHRTNEIKHLILPFIVRVQSIQNGKESKKTKCVFFFCILLRKLTMYIQKYFDAQTGRTVLRIITLYTHIKI